MCSLLPGWKGKLLLTARLQALHVLLDKETAHLSSQNIRGTNSTATALGGGETWLMSFLSAQSPPLSSSPSWGPLFRFLPRLPFPLQQAR